MARPESILSGIDEQTRTRLDELLRSDARRRVTDIYRQFGLADKGVKLRSFAAYAARVRGRVRRDGDRTVPGDRMSGPDTDVIAERILSQIQTVLDSGDPKLLPHYAPLMRAVTDYRRTKISEEIERRAAEKHAEWREQLVARKREADKALDQVAAEKGIPESVRDYIKDLYGIKV
ncbi:MAG: hypothetical protein U1A27_00135 [Phycisphaerae bacterium]